MDIILPKSMALPAPVQASIHTGRSPLSEVQEIHTVFARNLRLGQEGPLVGHHTESRLQLTPMAAACHFLARVLVEHRASTL
jgi:hypothetical protein